MKTLAIVLCIAAGAISAPAASACGVERWAVKTATDGSAINLKPVKTTIAKLNALPVPAGMGSHAPRLPGEHTTYQLTGTLLVSAKLEADSDYHLVLQSPGGQHMIAEIPDPACAAGSLVINQLTSDRASFDATFGAPARGFTMINRHVTITGVAFFDVLHGQTGVASNGIELHPVLTVKALGH